MFFLFLTRFETQVMFQLYNNTKHTKFHTFYNHWHQEIQIDPLMALI